MVIFNLRSGFATNSSSSHSILYVPPEQDIPMDTGDAPDFGWNSFIASSLESKKEYLGATLRHALFGLVTDDMTEAIVNTWVGMECDPDGGIDHQSVIAIPYVPKKHYRASGPSKEFFGDLQRVLEDRRVIIIGGNDNDENDWYCGPGEPIGIPFEMLDTGARALICRKDPEYGFWTVFNKDTGNKLRFFLDTEENSAYRPNRSSLPELVDLKITDYCEKDCPYCYQDSSVRGQHADPMSVRDMLGCLSGLGVFEVAFGGGEPTSYPGFAGILHYCYDCGIIPNFSTGELEWLYDSAIVSSVIECVGGVAYSTNYYNEVAPFVELAVSKGIPKNKLSVQHLVHDVTYLSSMIEACSDNGIVLTLLGAKRAGRGVAYFTDWDRIIEAEDGVCGHLLSIYNGQSHTSCTLSIDTVLAETLQPELDRINIPRYLYSTQEGDFSMAIDAVSGIMGPSSYCSEEELVALDMHPYAASTTPTEQIQNAFRGW
jgi:hypothetical protein